MEGEVKRYLDSDEILFQIKVFKGYFTYFVLRYIKQYLVIQYFRLQNSTLVYWYIVIFLSIHKESCFKQNLRFVTKNRESKKIELELD